MKIGIVGHGRNKFDERTTQIAKNLIRKLLSSSKDNILISGHSPVGGIDIWSEEIAKELGLEMDIKTPKQNTWNAEYGYKQRNLDIAHDSDEIHVILVSEYPKGYKGLRFNECYHCAKHNEAKIKKHVKSGGCWTGWEAVKANKHVYWHIISAPPAGGAL